MEKLGPINKKLGIVTTLMVVASMVLSACSSKPSAQTAQNSCFRVNDDPNQPLVTQTVIDEVCNYRQTIAPNCQLPQIEVDVKDKGAVEYLSGGESVGRFFPPQDSKSDPRIEIYTFGNLENIANGIQPAVSALKHEYVHLLQSTCSQAPDVQIGYPSQDYVLANGDQVIANGKPVNSTNTYGAFCVKKSGSDAVQCTDYNAIKEIQADFLDSGAGSLDSAYGANDIVAGLQDAGYNINYQNVSDALSTAMQSGNFWESFSSNLTSYAGTNVDLTPVFEAINKNPNLMGSSKVDYTVVTENVESNVQYQVHTNICEAPGQCSQTVTTVIAPGHEQITYSVNGDTSTNYFAPCDQIGDVVDINSIDQSTVTRSSDVCTTKAQLEAAQTQP